MKRGFFTAVGALAAAGLLAGKVGLRAEDLVTLSGTTFRDVQPVRADPDGVTWRYEGGLIKVDFADCPENIRRAYHYDPAKAEAFRETEAKARRQADEQVQRDAKEHDARLHARTQAAIAQTAAQQDGTGANGTLVFRRAMSPAASDATRATAARMQAEADQRAAKANEVPDLNHFVPTLPGLLGPRAINPYMDTPNAKEYAASLHHSPTGASGNFVPTTSDANRTTTLDTPIYLTRSYDEDVARSEAFLRGVPLK